MRHPSIVCYLHPRLSPLLVIITTFPIRDSFNLELLVVHRGMEQDPASSCRTEHRWMMPLLPHLPNSVSHGWLFLIVHLPVPFSLIPRWPWSTSSYSIISPYMDAPFCFDFVVWRAFLFSSGNISYLFACRWRVRTWYFQSFLFQLQFLLTLAGLGQHLPAQLFCHIWTCLFIFVF
jgi:hypothetical protein